KEPPRNQRNAPKPQDTREGAQPETCHIKQKRRHGEKVMKRPCPCTQPKDCSLLMTFSTTTRPHGERPRVATVGESHGSGRGRSNAGKKGVAITEQPDEDKEEDGGGVDPQRE